MSRPADSLFDATIRIDRLPSAGRELSVSLDADTRAKLAEQLKLLEVQRFDAEVTIVKLRGGIRAQGRLRARIVQPSVVTFEPVAQDIDEPIDRVFLPTDDNHRSTPGSEVYVDLDDEDFPDHIDGPEVDLSAMLIETLALAIDPYPRLPDENLEDLGLGASEPEAGPFAALSKLKKPTEE